MGSKFSRAIEFSIYADHEIDPDYPEHEISLIFTYSHKHPLDYGILWVTREEWALSGCE